MRILLNTPSRHLEGGPATHLWLLEEGLRARLDVIPFHYGRRSDHESVARKCLGRFSDLLAVRRLLRSARPDMVHLNTAFDTRALLRDAPLVRLCKSYGVPVFLKVHGSFPEAVRPLGGWTGWCQRTIVDHCAGLGVLSAEEGAEFESAFPALRGRVHVVKNIIPPIYGQVERREADTPEILFVARFLRKKGPFDLLKAVPLVLQRAPEARFIFAGDGPDAAEFDAEVERCRLGASVERLPQMAPEQVAGRYGTAWAFAFPTHFAEGMPMVVAQALASGVPVLAPNLRFVKSYLKDDESVLLIDPENPGSIASQLIRLIDDSRLRKKLAESGGVVARGFDTDTAAAEFHELYRALIARRQSNRSSASKRLAHSL